ncbi:MAG TPA: plasmid pRiA4b ORF-3 family protein [Solirubrobacterales bacterium]|nr:plasmid pRiA4b ORF-3 family protein [Solirubrobacterales bacterium]
MKELQEAETTARDRGAGGTDTVVQIKVKLRGVSKPPVWRRLLVPADTPLDLLHQAIVAAFGWQGYHLHIFTSGSDQFGVPDPQLGLIDERRVSLGQLVGGVGDRLLYTYDLGDGWEHGIEVEGLLDADPEVLYPVLLGAKGACPPEDCGGAWGYAELKQVLADPTHDEHGEMLSWLGLDDASAFDPKGLDAEEIEEEIALSGDWPMPVRASGTG